MLLFDESINKKTQEKQLDFHVRYWEKEHVESHYFTSDFLGHATADDLLKSFEKCVACLPKKNLLQLSMDGPSVNWKFYKSFQESLHSRQDCLSISMISIGACGLHIVHNAFKSGMIATEWKFDHLLLCLYQLFKDTPARRLDYVNTTAVTNPIFPLKFCKTRWLENVVVLERALSILPDFTKYIKAIADENILIHQQRHLKLSRKRAKML